MKYWIFKSEPNCFSYDDLWNTPQKTEHWDSVRNYQARNFMRDDMQVGDKGIFYHSSCKAPHAVGSVVITKAGYPDFTAWDPHSEHPDSKSTPESPIWFMVDVTAEKKFEKLVTLQEMKNLPELTDMRLLQRGNRLSVMPIEKHHYEIICQMGT